MKNDSLIDVLLEVFVSIAVLIFGIIILHGLKFILSILIVIGLCLILGQQFLIKYVLWLFLIWIVLDEIIKKIKEFKDGKQ